MAILNTYPVNYAGFIFAKSKRQVTAELAKELILKLRGDILPVGVFVDEAPEVVNALIQTCGLKVVQLHGCETVDNISAIDAPVWKSISIENSESLEALKQYVEELPEGWRFKCNNLQGFLLDTKHNGQTGGTGKAFDWSILSGIVDKYPIILAGGLTPENIREAAQNIAPKVLDVNSGVEVNLIKDREKIEQLFKALED